MPKKIKTVVNVRRIAHKLTLNRQINDVDRLMILEMLKESEKPGTSRLNYLTNASERLQVRIMNSNIRKIKNSSYSDHKKIDAFRKILDSHQKDFQNMPSKFLMILNHLEIMTARLEISSITSNEMFDDNEIIEFLETAQDSYNTNSDAYRLFENSINEFDFKLKIVS